MAGRRGKKTGAPELGELTRDDIRELFAKDAIMQSEMADSRGEFGRHVAQLETKKGFIPKIYRALRSVTRGKNPASIQAALKTFNHYAELAGFNDQKDIEDFLKSQPDTRTEHEKQMDGEVDALPKDQTGSTIENVVADPNEKKALRSFEKAMKDAADAEAVNKGVEKFLADWPDLEDEAMNIASARIQAIGQASSGKREPASVH